MFLQFFMLVYNDVIQNKPKHSTKFFSSINVIYLTQDRQADISALIILKFYFGKNDS